MSIFIYIYIYIVFSLFHFGAWCPWCPCIAFSKWALPLLHGWTLRGFCGRGLISDNLSSSLFVNKTRWRWVAQEWPFLAAIPHQGPSNAAEKYIIIIYYMNIIWAFWAKQNSHTISTLTRWWYLCKCGWAFGMWLSVDFSVELDGTGSQPIALY